MKKLLTLLMFLVSILNYAQNQQKISFEYDSAGNQIIRKLCLTCLAKTSKSEIKEISDLDENDLKKFNSDDVISYYPNPVKEQLYLKWQVIDNIYVNSIDLYSLSGQLIKSYKNLEGKDSFVILFSDLPQNVYSINLIYTNGEHKPITIIKN